MAFGPKKLHLSDGNLSPPASMATKSGAVIEAEDPWLNQPLEGKKKLLRYVKGINTSGGLNVPGNLYVVARS